MVPGGYGPPHLACSRSISTRRRILPEADLEIVSTISTRRTLLCGVTWLATSGAGDSVYSEDRRLQGWLEAQHQAYVLAVSGKKYLWLDWQQQVKTLLAALPEDGWTCLSASDGAKGPRWYDWRGLSLIDPPEPSWRRWLLVRQHVSAPQELQAYVILASQETT
jgi:hypothetical protein